MSEEKLDIKDLGLLDTVNDNDRLVVSKASDGTAAALSIGDLKEKVIKPLAGEGGSNGPAPKSLGEIGNVDASFDQLSNGKYTFEMRDGIFYPVDATGMESNIMRLTFVSAGAMTVGHGNPAVIEYNFISTFAGEPTGNGSAIYTVNGKRVFAGTIPQGKNSFDLGPFLDMGENTVTVVVKDSEGTQRELEYNIQAVNLYIASTFDASVPITEDTFNFRYTPVGSVQKTIHFKLDGVEVATFETSQSNRQLSQTLPNKGHGSHLLEVYMTTNTDGTAIESNHLYFDLICVGAGNDIPIIASSFNQTLVEQYSTVVIPYCVYDPTASETDIALQVDGQTVSTLRVDGTRKWWNYKLNNHGTVQMAIVCRTVKKTFTLQVTESSIDVEAETNGLELFLSSMGRSNSETNRDQWTFTGKAGTISAQMTGFNWATNGWVSDENGNMALKLSGDARVDIPLKVFERDIRTYGKTIEIEFSTSGVTDYEAIIASCWDSGKGFRISAQEAVFAGDSTSVKSRFKEEERIRISFAIDERAGDRLIYTYINGINSGTKQYVDNESFTQTSPQGITLGSNNCVMYVYNIRVYDNILNQNQVLDNFIADMDDMDKKITLFERNRIFDDYGEITYNKVCNFIPCMTITGVLPQYKGDKKTVNVMYEDRNNPAKSFEATNCQIDVQGTSSQYYPRKNYKTKFRSGFTMTATGEHVEGYKLNENSIPASVFCEKADFAESSGTHNTGLANLINDTLKELGYLTPPQVQNDKVRTTVEGFPMVIFHKEDENSPVTFLGKYNFNTDKAAEETFGFTDPAKTRCIEVRNNTSPRVLFQQSDFSIDPETNKPGWLDDFEYRYPDSDEFMAGFETDPVPHDFKRLCDWIVGCKDNPSKFKAEAEQYFNVPNLVSYFCLTELLGMVDQRAKNMFFTTWDGLVWYLIFYDNDTCLGINNEGEISFNFDIETRPGNENVWNAYGSELWKNVQVAFKDDIANLYKRLRTDDILSYEKVYNYMNKNQSDKWCEAIYNADSKFKYIDPLVDGYWDYGKGGFIYTGEFLYALQGSRADHRKWWLYNRFRYMDSKYNTGQYFGDTATMRLYTPATWGGVAPNADFTLTPYADQYLRVRYGSIDRGGEEPSKKGVPTVISAPSNITFNDTETIIYGASRLKSVGDLSSKYPGTVDMSSATQLEELIIGSAEPGYENKNLRSVTVKSNKLLRKIDIQNCREYKDALDLSGCESIQEVYAKGSGISSVVLPAGGNLRIMQLPSGIRNLRITNQQQLTSEGFSIEGVNNLMTLVLENVGFDVFEFLNLCLKAEPKALERVRLIDIKGTAPNSAILTQMAGMGGIDSAGNDTDRAVCTGDINIRIMYSRDLSVFNNLFPDLKITYDKLAVYFKDKLVEERLVGKYDKSGDGYLEVNELQMIEYFDKELFSGKDIVSFDELEEFENFHTTNYDAFKNCTKLVSIKFPPNMRIIGQGTFQGCTSLKKMMIPDTVTDIKGTTMYGCSALEEFIARNITQPIDHTCTDCTSLKRAVITGTYTSVGDSTFDGCSKLEEAILPDTVTTFGTRVFYRSGLKSYVLPPELTKMGYDTFNGCPELERVTIPATMQSMGGYTFYECIALKEVVILAKTPPTVASNTFTKANPGVKIYVPDESVDSYKNAANWSLYADKIRPLSARV